MLQNWDPQSWFYQNLGQPARDVVGRAYGVLKSTPREQTSSQEYLALALDIFAQKIGAERTHVVHALLTNNVINLMAAIIRKEGKSASIGELAEAWSTAFREASFAT